MAHKKAFAKKNAVEQQRKSTSKAPQRRSSARTHTSPVPDDLVQHFTHLQQTIGNQAVAHLAESGALQASRPAEDYEREADQVAVIQRKGNKEPAKTKEDEKPYIPGSMSKRFQSLTLKEKAKVNKQVNEIFRAQTGFEGQLDWENESDKPLARTWLRIRDEVMASRVIEPEGKEQKEKNRIENNGKKTPVHEHEQFELLKRASLQELKAQYRLILARTEGTKWAHQDFIENIYGIWGAISSSRLLGNVELPDVTIWEQPALFLNGVNLALQETEAASSMETMQQNLKLATKALKNARDAYNEAYEQWDTFRQGAIGGAGTGKLVVEIGAGVAMAVATGAAGGGLRASTLASVEFGSDQPFSWDEFLQKVAASLRKGVTIHTLAEFIKTRLHIK